jgi:hypothetical protein
MAVPDDLVNESHGKVSFDGYPVLLFICIFSDRRLSSRRFT